MIQRRDKLDGEGAKQSKRIKFTRLVNVGIITE